MVDDPSRHLGLGPSDARGAARNPLSGERPDGDEPLRANDGAVGCEPRHQGEDPDDAGGVAPKETFSLNTLASPRCTASARRRQRRQMATARRKASVLVQDVSVVDDDSEQL
jgi:hypothetical protein